MQQSASILTNTSYLTVALIIQKVIAFFFFLALAHVLGGAGTGEYVAAFAFSAFFGVFLDLGLGNILVRDIARNPEDAGRLLGLVVPLKIILAGMVLAALLGTIALLDWWGALHPRIELVAVAGFIMIGDAFLVVGSSIFRGWQTLWEESVVTVLNKLGALLFGGLALLFVPTPVAVALAVLAGGVFSYAYMVRVLRARLPQWKLSWNHAGMRTLLLRTTPFALAALFSAAYAQIDTILLSTIKGNEAVGLYSVAAKTMNAFVFIPAAFIAAVYPAMSKSFVAEPTQLRRVLQDSLRGLLLVSVPLAVGLYLLADEFVFRIGAEYGPSATAVRLLLPSLVFMFLSYPLGALLNATDRQHWQTTLFGVVVALNIALNVWLIPQWSYVGSAVAWSATNVLLFAVGIFLSRLVLPWSLGAFAFQVVRTVLAAGAMGALVIWLRDEISIFMIVPVAGVVYVLVLVALREVTRTDYELVQRLFTVKQ